MLWNPPARHSCGIYIPGRGTEIQKSDDMSDGRHLHDSVESDTESTVEDTMESLVERAREGESSGHTLGNAISPQVVDDKSYSVD